MNKADLFIFVFAVIAIGGILLYLIDRKGEK